MSALVSAVAVLTGSRLGRICALGALALAGLLLAWRIAVASGERRAALAMTERALDNLRDRISTDDQIARLPPAARRDRLRAWSNHGV